MEDKSLRFQAIITIISIAGFIGVSILCLLAARFGQEWATKMMDTIVPMVIQCWIINFTTAINYWCGSSHQQQQQTDTMQTMARKLDLPIELTDEVAKKPHA